MTALMAALVLLGVPVAAVAGPYPPSDKASAQVSPSRIRPGECAVFSGQGFKPFVPIAIADNGKSLGSVLTDRAGRFSKEICYGTDVRPGRHTLTGTGQTEEGVRTVSAVLIITGVRQSATGAGGGSTVLATLPRTEADAAGGGLPLTGLPALALTVFGTALVAAGSMVLLATERRHRRRRRTAV